MKENPSNNEETQEWFRNNNVRGPSPYSRKYQDQEDELFNPDNDSAGVYNSAQEEPGYDDWDTSTRPLRSQRTKPKTPSHFNEGLDEMPQVDSNHEEVTNPRSDLPMRGQRAKYHAKMDRFLNNGILLVGVLLILVLVIAFLL